MRFFFDTSVLIAAFLEDHEHHEKSFAAFVKAEKKSACCAAHSLAEVYSILIRLPGRHRLSGDQALLFLHTIRERLQTIPLDGAEYYTAIEEAAAGGILGGAIYDALLAHCAQKSRADIVYTWNVKHFERFHEVAARIMRPGA